jgi:hypothetical protein
LKGSGSVHIPFLDVAYRIVAIALSLSCGRRVWYGLVERKITSFNNGTDILARLRLRPTRRVALWLRSPVHDELW